MDLVGKEILNQIGTTGKGTYYILRRQRGHKGRVFHHFYNEPNSMYFLYGYFYLHVLSHFLRFMLPHPVYLCALGHLMVVSDPLEKSDAIEDERELYDENYKVLAENKEKGIPVFVVTMKTPRPQITNIEVIAA